MPASFRTQQLLTTYDAKLAVALTVISLVERQLALGRVVQFDSMIHLVRTPNMSSWFPFLWHWSRHVSKINSKVTNRFQISHVRSQNVLLYMCNAHISSNHNVIQEKPCSFHKWAYNARIIAIHEQFCCIIRYLNFPIFACWIHPWCNIYSITLVYNKKNSLYLSFSIFEKLEFLNFTQIS